MFYNIVLLRLVNNDRVIGIGMDSYEDDITALYAPMSILKTDKDISMLPYDELTDSPFAIFDNHNILTINVPAEKVKHLYTKNKIFFYPELEDLQDEIKDYYQFLMGDHLYDFGKIKDMFNEFLKDKE